MVVCKCRKATKLYCFVHKVPVCGECICFQEHRFCVAGTYSAWVIDGDFDWPTRCCKCHTVLDESTDSQTTRFGCMHNIHTDCLVSHIKSLSPDTDPAGYTCPACSTPIWPPKSIKNTESRLHTQLKEAIMQSGIENKLFVNDPVSSPDKHSHGPPPAFDSDPLKPKVASENASVNPSTVDIDGPVSVKTNHEPNFSKTPNSGGSGATTRKTNPHGEKQTSEFSYRADDEERKYTRRGNLRDKFMRWLQPLWSNALPALPVTLPPKKDEESHTRHHRRSRMDPRKILLVIAIMACMATMGVLYYRIAQKGFGEEQ